MNHRNLLIEGRLRLSLLLAAVVLLVSASSAHATFMVFGEETSAGNYSFILQGMPGDPVQNRGTLFPNLDFGINLPGLDINSTTGNISDGVNALTPAQFGWDAVGFDSFDPAGVNLALVTQSGDAGTDITTIVWRFTSQEAFDGVGLRGLVKTGSPPPSGAPIPEPSTMLLLGSGLAGLGFFRMRKKAA